MRLDYDYFARLRGHAVSVGPEDQAVEIELETIEALGPSPRDGGSFRLEFRGPREPVLPQGTHRFAVGGDAFEMFIVPVGRDSAGAIYEAVFN